MSRRTLYLPCTAMAVVIFVFVGTLVWRSLRVKNAENYITSGMQEETVREEMGSPSRVVFLEPPFSHSLIYRNPFGWNYVEVRFLQDGKVHDLIRDDF